MTVWLTSCCLPDKNYIIGPFYLFSYVTNYIYKYISTYNSVFLIRDYAHLYLPDNKCWICTFVVHKHQHFCAEGSNCFKRF